MDGWAIVLAVLDLFGFAVMAYRKQWLLDNESTSHGPDFPSYGCWICSESEPLTY